MSQKVDLFTMAHNMVEDSEKRLNYKEVSNIVKAIDNVCKELNSEYRSMSEDEILLDLCRKELQKIDVIYRTESHTYSDENLSLISKAYRLLLEAESNMHPMEGRHLTVALLHLERYFKNDDEI